MPTIAPAIIAVIVSQLYVFMLSVISLPVFIDYSNPWLGYCLHYMNDSFVNFLT